MDKVIRIFSIFLPVAFAACSSFESKNTPLRSVSSLDIWQGQIQDHSFGDFNYSCEGSNPSSQPIPALLSFKKNNSNFVYSEPSWIRQPGVVVIDPDRKIRLLVDNVAIFEFANSFIIGAESLVGNSVSEKKLSCGLLKTEVKMNGSVWVEDIEYDTSRWPVNGKWRKK